MAAETTTNQVLQLPMGVVTRADVANLLRETEAVDNFLRQAAIRQPGTSLQLPKTSRLFEEMVSSNNLNMLEVGHRQRLYQFLQAVRTEAPLLHMSFNADPSPLFAQRLMTWLRQELHPQVLLQIGLQPNIGAGCVVRTSNKYFDFSLRQRFLDQRKLLISKLYGAEGTDIVQEAPSPASTAANQEQV